MTKKKYTNIIKQECKCEKHEEFLNFIRIIYT